MGKTYRKNEEHSSKYKKEIGKKRKRREAEKRKWKNIEEDTA